MPPKNRRAQPEAPATQSAVGYVRVSTEEQAIGGLSLAAQEERIRTYCSLHALDLVAIYRDEGVSASKALDTRPQGAALVAALARGEARHVVAVKLDRLFRSAVDCLQRVSAWDQAGTAMHLIDHGGLSINTTSAMGRFFLTMLAGMAEWERNVIGERTAAALAQKALQGERLGSTPLGFRTPGKGEDMEPVEAELRTVRRILQRKGAGASFRVIAAELRASRIPTKRGGEWHASTVRAIWQQRERYKRAGLTVAA